MGNYHGSNCSNCPKPKPRSIIRSLTTKVGEGHDLDYTLLLPLKVILYAMAIALLAFMISRQVAARREAKKKAANMVKEGKLYSDGEVDVEKARAV